MAANSFWLGRKVPASPHKTAVLHGLFTPEECDRVIALGCAGRKIHEDRGNAAAVKRRSTQVWIGHDADPEISGKVAHFIRQVNDQTWQYDLLSFEEAFQYTEYRGDEGGCFDPFD